MAGLLDFLNPQDPAKQQGLLAAAAALLQAGGPSRAPISTGQGFGAALGAYQEGTQNFQDRAQRNQALEQALKLNGIKLKDAESDLANQQLLRDRQKRISDRLTGSGGAQLPAQADQQAPIASAMPGGAMSPAAATGAPRVNQTDAYVQRMLVVAQAHADEGDVDGAQKIYEQVAKLRPKFDSGISWVNGPDGKPVAVRTADDGSFKQLDGLSPREKLHFLSTGGATIGVNEYTGDRGASYTNTATPGDLLSAATQRRGQDITVRGQNLADSRAREQNAITAAKDKAPTEFQGKSAAFGLRATEANKILSDLEGQYSAAGVNAKNALGNVWGVGGALGAGANSLLSDNSQRVDQAQRDFINAILRQESGAAIGAGEFDNAAKQYFPQPGDSQAVIDQKARNRQLAVQGLETNAGRAAMRAPAAAGGWSITKVQ